MATSADDSLRHRISKAVGESKGRLFRALAGLSAALIFYGLCNSMSLKAIAHGDLATAGFNIGVGLVLFLLACAKAAVYLAYLARQVARR